MINGTTGAIEQTVAYYPFGAVIADLGSPTTGQPYKFGGKELLSANGLNEYDFGARNYDPAVPGFTKIDPLGEKYPWLSPFLYCANNPLNAFDPDGNLIIFLNGMHKGDGGKPEYWKGVDSDIKNKLSDRNVLYIDGSFGGAFNLISTIGPSTLGLYCSNYYASTRYTLGYLRGRKEAKQIYNNLVNNETIKIITHSMGAAAAKGFVEALLEYATNNNLDPRIIFELDIAPFQWWQQSGHSKVSTYTLSHYFDLVAGACYMRHAKNYRTHSEINNVKPLEEHSISSFQSESINVLDDILKEIDNGNIKLYLDGKRMN